MKKSLFFVAAATLVLASCNNDVKVDENVALEGSNAQKEIALTAYAHTPKRVQGQYAVTSAIFPDENSMEVAAYLTQPAGKARNYFTKTTFSNTAGVWTGGKYWPLAASKLNFFAVSGYGVDAGDITIEENLSAAGVAYTAAKGYDQTTQSDIMYAFGRGEVTANGNLFNFPTVNMEFKHALALIDFQVKGNSATEVAAITVNSITLNGAKYTGTLALANTNSTSVSDAVETTPTWTLPGDAINNVAVPGISASTAIAADYARIGKGLMVIPGTGFTNFVINYTCEGINYDFTYTPSPAVTTTAANTKYTYQINFKMHEIEIAPTVAAWETGATQEIIIPNMVYGQNYAISASKAAQTLAFTLTGFTAASGNKYKVTVGGTDDEQVSATTPSSSGTAIASSTAGVTATILANDGGADKTFTLTIQETTSADVNVGTATVITVTQAH